MNSNLAIPRNVLIFGLCIPLAVLVGYLLTTPLDFVSLGGVVSILGVLLVPILLRWHHLLLLCFWNAVVNAFFLPGQPRVWMALAAMSIGFSILNRVMNKEQRLQNVHWLTLPLVILTLVILVTAKLRGGIGLTSVGSGNFGGRKYLEALMAIVGYFALSWQKIPPKKALLYTSLFFLSGLTNAVSNLAYTFEIYWLFWIFPVDFAVLQIQSDYSVGDRAFLRLSGVAFACMAPFCFLIARHSLAGIFDLKSGWSLVPIRFRQKFHVNQPWRLLLFLSSIAISTFGGFRSMPILFAVIFAIQFYMEGLHRTRLLYVLLGCGILAGAAMLPFTERLPLVVQRAISFLPVKLNSTVKYDAWASTDWRIRMWNVVIDELPKYVWLGKGYGGNATDLFMVKESRRRGFISDFEGSYIAGDYHSGPLSVMIPLGIWGAIAFVWFLVVGLIALVRNYRHGPPELKGINRFLLAFYLGQVVFYFAAYGAFTSGLYLFTGTLGLSVSLNGGVAGANVPSPALAASASDGEGAPQAPGASVAGVPA